MNHATATAATRVAVIADVHGDLASLGHVLADIDRTNVDAIWCLGDIVGLATDPASVVDLVRERCAIVLAGNHDRWVTGELPLDMLPLPRQRAELRWQRDQPSAEQPVWLTARPAHAQHCAISLRHGNAIDPLTGYLQPARTPPTTSRASRRRPDSSGTRIARSSPGLTEERSTTTSARGERNCPDTPVPCSAMARM